MPPSHPSKPDDQTASSPSHVVLRDTVDKVGTKRVAAGLKLSPAMIYKWCQPSTGTTASGEWNPLDRILVLCEAANSDKPVKWLCERRNGVFVRNTALEFNATAPSATCAPPAGSSRSFPIFSAS